MFWKIFLLVAISGIASVGYATTETVFRLDDRSVPIVARQEKAQGLLHAWEMVGGDATFAFVLNGEDDLKQVQSALDHLMSKDDGPTTAPPLTSAAEHYLVWAMARSQMVNDLDFTTESLRNFFNLNISKYPCEPRATVSEFLVPKTYTDAAGSTAILEEISERLKKETFPRVAYHFNDRLGRHGTGYIGEVIETQAGPERFALYREVARSGHSGGGSGDRHGGPFVVPEGWLYIQVHSLVDGFAGCFDVYFDQVTQDYGREWLKKIAADTLATATAELKPEIFEYTTGTAMTTPAIKVASHEISFLEAKATLPFLMGDQRDPRFWKSIQRQALDVELIYHSTTGKTIRSLPEFTQMLDAMRLLAAARLNLANELTRNTTTATLTAWYEANRQRYTETEQVSYQVYECVTSASSQVSASNRARGAAALESLRTDENPAEFASLAHEGPGAEFVVNGITIHRDEITSASFSTLSREIQVACHQAADGEWSPVFTENGQQKVLKVIARKIATKALEDIKDRVAEDYRLQFRISFWQRFFGLTH